MRLRSTAALCLPYRISSSIAKAESRGYAMLPFKLVYHPGYDLNLGAHVFPSQKFRMIYETLLREKIAAPEDFLEPLAASDDDVGRVHTAEYAEQLQGGTLSPRAIMPVEIPATPEMVQACWL